MVSILRESQVKPHITVTIWYVSHLQLKSRIYTVKSYGDDEHKVESRFLKSTEVGTTSAILPPCRCLACYYAIASHDTLNSLTSWFKVLSELKGMVDNLPQRRAQYSSCVCVQYFP